MTNDEKELHELLKTAKDAAEERLESLSVMIGAARTFDELLFILRTATQAWGDFVQEAIPVMAQADVMWRAWGVKPAGRPFTAVSADVVERLQKFELMRDTHSEEDILRMFREAHDKK